MSDIACCESCRQLTSVRWSGLCPLCYAREYSDPPPIVDKLDALITRVEALPDLARQARTIRRLFTAYFLAKAKALRNGYEADKNCARCMLQGETLERARIIAAIRASTWAKAAGPSRAWACAIADAIERGEL